MSLLEIGTKHNTDKVYHHHYERFYPFHIDFVKNIDNAGIFEIGLYQGASLKTWLEYFPKAWVYGLDIQKGCEGERHKIFKGDQSKEDDLKRVVSLVNHPIYYINDDGSHMPEHQILSFTILFESLLQNGGVYIIEDIETSYWSKNGLYGYPTRYGFGHQNSIIEKFKPILDYINREFIKPDDLTLTINKLTASGFSIQTLNLISSVTFAQNCIIIRKMTETELLFPPRPYKFAQNL